MKRLVKEQKQEELKPIEEEPVRPRYPRRSVFLTDSGFNSPTVSVSLILL